MILRTMTHMEQISSILISTESTRVVEIYEPIEIDDGKLNRIVKNYYPKSSGAHQRGDHVLRNVSRTNGSLPRV